jgi:hypothetical protein
LFITVLLLGWARPTSAPTVSDRLTASQFIQGAKIVPISGSVDSSNDAKEFADVRCGGRCTILPIVGSPYSKIVGLSFAAHIVGLSWDAAHGIIAAAG